MKELAWIMTKISTNLKFLMKKLPRNLEMSVEVCIFAPAKCNGSGFSAVGSAHVWGARGRWFESSNPDQKQFSSG